MAWLNLTLFYMDLFIILFLAAFPIVVLVVHGWHKLEIRYNLLVIMPGLLLGIHLIWTAYSVWSTIHPPPGYIVICLHPFDQIVQDTANWSIPLGFLGMILAFALPME